MKINIFQIFLFEAIVFIARAGECSCSSLLFYNECIQNSQCEWFFSRCRTLPCQDRVFQGCTTLRKFSHYSPPQPCFQNDVTQKCEELVDSCDKVPIPAVAQTTTKGLYLSIVACYQHNCNYDEFGHKCIDSFENCDKEQPYCYGVVKNSDQTFGRCRWLDQKCQVVNSPLECDILKSQEDCYQFEEYCRWDSSGSCIEKTCQDVKEQNGSDCQPIIFRDKLVVCQAENDKCQQTKDFSSFNLDNCNKITLNLYRWTQQNVCVRCDSEVNDNVQKDLL